MDLEPRLAALAARPAGGLQDGGTGAAPAGRVVGPPRHGYLPGMEQWITPGVVVAVGIGLWRLMAHETRTIRDDIRELSRRVDHLGDRLDRHLDGHAPKVPS